MNTHNPHQFRHRIGRSEQLQTHTTFVRPLVRTLRSDALFRGDHEIGIEHHGALYRLKITRQGKLILNK